MVGELDPFIIVCDCQVHLSGEAKYLGVSLSEDLYWQRQGRAITVQCYGALHFISSVTADLVTKIQRSDQRNFVNYIKLHASA